MPRDDTPATDTPETARRRRVAGRRSQPDGDRNAPRPAHRPVRAPAGRAGAVALEGASARRAAGRRLLRRSSSSPPAAGWFPPRRSRPRAPAAAGRSLRRWRRSPPAAASASARDRRGCSRAPPWAPTRSSARSPPPPRATSTPWCWAPAPAYCPAAASPRSRAAPWWNSPRPPRRPAAPRRRAKPAATPRRAAGVVSQRGVDDVSVLSADAQADRQASAGAVMRYAAEDGDLRGSAAAACQQPANDLWLVGANTALGRTAVLNLSNASGSAATVSLELFGAKGQIQAPGSRGLLVAPGTTRSIILAGLAPGQERLSVRVRSAGGPVAAVIQQSVLRGLTPGGVEFIAPATAPALRQVISGVDIQDPAGLAGLTGKSGFGDAGPALQIAVPGSADAVVAVKLYGRDGQKALPGGGVVTAKAGTVTEVPLVRRAGRALHRGRQLGRVLHRRGPCHRGVSKPRMPPISPGPRPRCDSEASTLFRSRNGGPLPDLRRSRGPGHDFLHPDHGGRQGPAGRGRRHRRRHHGVHQGPCRRRRLTARRLPRVRRGGPRLRRRAPAAGRPAGHLNGRDCPRQQRARSRSRSPSATDRRAARSGPGSDAGGSRGAG